jgi:hypothetical protein
MPLPVREFARGASGRAIRYGLYSAWPLLKVDPPPTRPLRGVSFYCSWAAANIDGHVRVLA